ncbi:MAG TPA: alpha/beta hydrolase-fold protein [Chloroflexota bacterium]|nr:alpha/beta hydrolase-fold protein [Chloroflexota bacterium]
MLLLTALAMGVQGSRALQADGAADSPSRMTVFAPDASAYGHERRLRLAQTVVLFPHGEDDDRLEDGVFLLPAPLPWPPHLAGKRAWDDLTVPSNVPIFLLAAVAPARPGFVSMPRITLNGVPLDGHQRHTVPGLHISDGAGYREHVALGLVLMPPEPGRHTIQVDCNGCAPTQGPWLSLLNGAPRRYTLDVQVPLAAPRNDAAPAPGLSLSPIAPSAGVSMAQVEQGETVGARFWQLVERLGDAVAPSSDERQNGLGVSTKSAEVQVLDRTFFSQALGREMPYRAYLPVGYERSAGEAPSQRRYPVVYLLHGLGSGHRQWSNLGIEQDLSRLEAPYIVIAPAGRAGYWVNHADGGPRWGDYVTQDLIGHVDTTFRTIPTRDGRAIGGLSMGGHGALQLALNQPHLFRAVGAHSPAIRTRDQAPAFLGGLGLVSPGALAPSQTAFSSRDPISLVRRSVPTPRPRLWIDVGEEDSWAPRARELHEALLTQKWEHQWQLAPGKHESAYWSRRMAEYVRYYATSLEGQG